jgi:hypothetical protein
VEDCGKPHNLRRSSKNPGTSTSMREALNVPYMQLRATGFAPRLAELLDRLQYTSIADDLVRPMVP